MMKDPADFKTPLDSLDPQVKRRLETHSHYHDSIFVEFLKRQKTHQRLDPQGSNHELLRFVLVPNYT